MRVSIHDRALTLGAGIVGLLIFSSRFQMSVDSDKQVMVVNAAQQVKTN
jgi:hypothetical protein